MAMKDVEIKKVSDKLYSVIINNIVLMYVLVNKIFMDRTYITGDIYEDAECKNHLAYVDWNWSKYRLSRVLFKVPAGHPWLKEHNRNNDLHGYVCDVFQKAIADSSAPEPPKDPKPEKPEKKVEVKEDRKPANLLSKVKAAMEARKAAAAANQVKDEVVSKEADHDEEDQGTVRIFTDGACSPNPVMGGWGVVMYDARGGKHEYSGADSTNNRMELRGPIEALKKCSGRYPIVLTSDSNYLVKGMTEWIQGWIQKGWKNSQRQPVPNRDLWEELLALTQGKRIEWKWVKGHSVNADNNRCDELAVFAREQLAAELAQRQDVEVYEDGCDSDLLGLDEGI